MNYVTVCKKGKPVPGEILAEVNNLPAAVPRFMMDRDQVFYSRAFRRLAGKTQLFAAGKDEDLRTRLTHTLEVSQIARAIAQALGLDLDLTEAIVLGHDLGHTPFGHVGERTLHEIMTPDPEHILGADCPLCGDPAVLGQMHHRFLGFKHNLQSLVVAQELEKNASGRGLNLTEFTLYGIQAHTRPRYKPGRIVNHDMLGYYDSYLGACRTGEGEWAWSLEAMLVAQADEIAQLHHDLEDALREGLVTPEEVVRLVVPMLAHSERQLSRDEAYVLDNPCSCDREAFLYVFTRIVVELLMNKLAEMARVRIIEQGDMIPVRVAPHNPRAGYKTASTVKNAEACEKIFTYGPANEQDSFAAAVDALAACIGGRILNAQTIRNADEEGKTVIQALFQAYYAHPELLPDECVFDFFDVCHGLKNHGTRESCRLRELPVRSEPELRELAYEEGMDRVRQLFCEVFADRAAATDLEKLLLMRTICNHIASMTDAEARRTHAKIVNP